MKRVRQLLMVSLLILGSFTAAHAASYYVASTSGADANSGTSSAAPWKSLSKVNSMTFQPGDVINFKRGSVWQGSLVVDSNGTASAPVTYQAYGTGAAPQIKNPGVNYGNDIEVTGDYNIIQGFFLTDTHEAGVVIRPGADRNIVQNNEMTRTGIGVLTNGQYNLITKNYAHDLTIIVNTLGGSDDYGAVGFFVQAANNEISYNRCINCIAPSHDFGNDGGCVEVYNQGDNLYVHHNYCENTAGFFELGASGSGSAANVGVVYNVVYNPHNGTAVCFNVGSFNITMSNFVFDNNTFIAQSGDTSVYRVFGCRTDLSFMTVRNNIFYSDTQIANSAPGVHTNNLYYMVNMVSGSGLGYALGSGEKTGNPRFVNVRAGDFHLQAGSPAIEAGIRLGYAQDFDGNTVPHGAAPDIGAYEYGGATPTLLPPQNLRFLP